VTGRDAHLRAAAEAPRIGVEGHDPKEGRSPAAAPGLTALRERVTHPARRALRPMKGW
jgi:hypothetical protein